MANIKSAKKRIKVLERRTAENRRVKSTVSTYRKQFKKLIAEKNLIEAEKKFKQTESLIYSAVSKGIFHQNKANRIVGTMSAQLYYTANPKTKAIAPVTSKAVTTVAPAPAPVIIEKEKAAKKVIEPVKKTVVKKVEEKAAKVVKKEEKKEAASPTVKKTTVTKTPAKKVEKKAEVKTEKKAPAKPVAKKATATKPADKKTTPAKKAPAKK